MSNNTAKTITTNIVPVQGTFEPLPPYECINLIGPAGTPFFAPTNPDLDGVSITNSTINSTTIGVTTPAAGAFTTASATNQPVGNNDLTTKLYVDSLALGISWKQPVNAATTANITLSGAQTIDTVSVVAGDRVLVKNQTAPAENGIYIAAAGAWSRSPDANIWDELVSALVFVESGAQAGSAWYCPVQPGGTLGVTAITWNNFSVGGVYFAGTGLNLSGGDTFNITNTGVTAATYGSASAVPAIAVNQQGQITSASNTNIAIAGSQVTSGTIDSARISGSYTGITAVGTLSGLTVSSTITGSISGNAATATTAGSATTATTATNIAGGATGSIPYQSSAGTTTFLAAGTNGQVLTLAGGVPTYATPSAGTVTSVGGTGTVSGISLSGTVTSSGNLTLGGTLDLSAPPAIGGTTANTVRGTTVTATTGFVGTNFDAAGSGGGNLRNSSGTAQIQWGGGGGNNVSIDVATNINPANAAVAISPTGTGTVAISPAGALTVNPTTASTMNNVAIGGTTPLAGTFTDLRVNNTISLAGTTGTAGFVLTSNGASAPTWQAVAAGLTITDDTTTNATRYLAFTSATSGTITGQNVSSTKLQFNPSSGILTSTGFAGALNGTVGATTASTGAFTTLTSNGATTFTANTASTSTTTGTTVITGGLGVSGRINAANFDGIVGANTAAAGSFTTLGASGVATFSAGSVSAPAITTTGDTNTGIYFPSADTIAFAEGGVAVGQFDSSGNFKFNSGYGSVATAYGCRAWVNFDGTGTPAIRASGNVSSITDNGTGNYTVNLTNAMPDENFSVEGITNSNTGDMNRPVVAVRTGSSNNTVVIQTVGTFNNNTNVDCSIVNVSIHR
jgi:hypothetical protein